MEKDSLLDTDNSLFFTDGWVASADRVMIAAKLNALAEEYFSRVLYYWRNQWFHTDITDAVHSACFDSGSDSCLWLGQAGTVTAMRKGAGPITYEIGDAKYYGNLNRIRSIDGEVYVCGYGGQVYRRDGEGWRHMDEGILVAKPDANSVDLFDIDGSSAENLYAVGTAGAVFHYDGRRWTSADPPTNMHLTRVRCVSPKEVYVCGFRGTLIRGDGRAWENLGDPDVSENFYGLDVFEESLYVAGNSGLWRLIGQSMVPVDLGIQRPATFHRLHANDGVLWSFGTDDLFFFDGHQWTEVVPPDNEPGEA